MLMAMENRRTPTDTSVVAVQWDGVHLDCMGKSKSTVSARVEVASCVVCAVRAVLARGRRGCRHWARA